MNSDPGWQTVQSQQTGFHCPVSQQFVTTAYNLHIMYSPALSYSCKFKSFYPVQKRIWWIHSGWVKGAETQSVISLSTVLTKTLFNTQLLCVIIGARPWLFFCVCLWMLCLSEEPAEFGRTEPQIMNTEKVSLSLWVRRDPQLSYHQNVSKNYNYKFETQTKPWSNHQSSDDDWIQISPKGLLLFNLFNLIRSFTGCFHIF